MICFTTGGAEVILKIKEAFPDVTAKGFMKSESPCPDGIVKLEGDVNETIGDCFLQQTPLIFIGAVGIVSRLIAPFIKDKLQDIPVLAIDEKMRFVIPVLSGHAGGANDLAGKIAEALHAIPVITTATDEAGAFAADTYAVQSHLTIANKNGIKKVSSKSLSGNPIVIAVNRYTPHCVADIVISEEMVTEDALLLKPKRYVLGIGCKKGKPLEEIENAVTKALEKCGISYEDIFAFASFEGKRNEQGLLDLSAKYRLPFVTFPADLLQAVEGDFSASAFVKEQIGVDNVCERSAILLTNGCGKLVLKKQAENGVTVAVAKYVI